MNMEAISGNDKNSHVAAEFFDNASAPRINTDVFIYDAIKKEHPGVDVVHVEEVGCSILRYINATGDGKLLSLTDGSGSLPKSFSRHVFLPPVRRLDGEGGSVGEDVNFNKYLLQWNKSEFLLYVLSGRDGTSAFQIRSQFIVSKDKPAIMSLIKTVGSWHSVLHDEIWVFNQGYWQKDALLYQSILKSKWEDVILDKELKEDLIDTVQRFFDSREQYHKLGVPWKRGLIFYGPPGNGKTISIKATMHTLYQRKPAIPTLYVKSLQSFAGPEYSISQIFGRARRDAPCYLVFEDLDSLVTDAVRSFFLNAVDGLAENEGILMMGSTNHLDRLDPGIAKRPSRFDRKYLFPDPNFEQRVNYCHFWQKKLKDNKEIEFPDKLCPAIAKITEKFSFAYMQEAFVSSLLTLANSRKHESTDLDGMTEAWNLIDINEESKEDNDNDDKDKLDRYILWREIKIQVNNLRKEISDDVLIVENRA